MNMGLYDLTMKDFEMVETRRGLFWKAVITDGVAETKFEVVQEGNGGQCRYHHIEGEPEQGWAKYLKSIKREADEALGYLESLDWIMSYLEPNGNIGVVIGELQKQD